MLRLLVVPALLFAFCFVPARANPTTELLQIVPAETNVCLVLQNLREHSEQIIDSPFVKWFATSTYGKLLLAGPDVKKLRDVETVLAKQLGMTTDDLRQEIFGDAVVLAYQPGPLDKPQMESGVLLVKARDAKKLDELFRKLNEAQTDSGELERIEKKTHKNTSYSARIKRDGKTEYICIQAGLLIATGQEHALQRTIEQQANAKKNSFVSVYEKLGYTQIAAAVLFNPRAWDAEWNAKIVDAPDANAKAFQTQFLKLWQSADAIGLALHLKHDAELSLGLALNPAKVPLAFQAMLEPGEPTALWNAIPPNALFASAGKLRIPALLKVAQSFLADEGIDALKTMWNQSIAPIIGKDALPMVLRELGPDYAFWLTAPGKNSASKLPILTLAVRVKQPSAQEPQLAKAALNALDFAFQTIRVDHNRTHDDQFQIEESKIENDSIKSLVNEKALPGIQPSFALRGDYIVVASHAEGVRSFTSPSAAPKDAQGLIMKLNAAGIVAYLAEHKKPVAEFFAVWNDRKPAEVQAEFADFAMILEMLNRAELRRTGTADQPRITLKLQFAEPLKK